MNATRLSLHVLLLSAFASVAPAQAPSPPRAARSVHLRWPAPKADLFYLELTVEQSTPGSYFMACGFNHGYFGIQELANGNKVVLFSVWDPVNPHDLTAKADQTPAEQRTEVLGSEPDVKVSRFGGEGTGGKSMWSYPWTIGETCRFCVRGVAEGEKTTFTGYFFLPAENRWKQLATFRTITGGKPLAGFYSFVEDFRRDGKSPGEMRRARFGNGWVRTLDGDWVSLQRAKFTADQTPLDNMDGGIAGEGFYLATGGETKNQAPLGSVFQRQPIPLPPAPSPTGDKAPSGK
ncbi:MAG TPA: DUF3472 domain-containing protein [Chthoniobacteraceae bacterium]|nr:DUF3472 domain-containing protein [Chthoniobacteraceae bacterium]